MDLGLGTLTELKRHLLNEALRSATTYDRAIANLGRGVAARFEKVCDRKFARVVSDTHECDADRSHVSLPRYPVESVSAIAMRETLADGWVDQGTVSDLVEQLREESGIVDFGTEPGARPARLKLTYTGGYWYPGRGAPQTVRATVDLDTAAESYAVVFATAFAGTPVVRCAIILANGVDSGMSVWPSAATRAGFTAVFGAPVPTGTKLHYTAIGTPITGASSRFQCGLIPLAAGATSVALGFGSGFAAAPQVIPVVIIPTAAGSGVTVWPHTVTVNGATLIFGAAIPAAGYQVAWIAIGDSLIESDDDELQRGTAALEADDETCEVELPMAFESAPVITAQVMAPDGSASGIEAWPVQSSISATGFTVQFSAPVPAAGYSLHWFAASVEGLPSNAHPLPDDLRLAWLLQCEYLWKLRDKLGLEIAGGSGEGAQLVSLTLAGAKLVPEVEETLRGYTRLTF